jgi:phospholipid-binding lipoprotein MlaA
MLRTAPGPVLLVATVTLGLLAGCAARQPGPVPPDYDPIRPLNVKIFWFNDKVDTYVLTPLATGWDKVAPRPVRRSLSNFFTNINTPIVAVNDVLQGKVKHGAVDVGRFAVNTTVGVLGFLDPATRWGLEQHVEDFGQTLGRWGVPPGPYLVLPFLGPSDPRDLLGMGVDSAMLVYPFFVDTVILTGAQAGARVTDTVNARSLILREVRDAKEAALDYYVFVRNAYIQRRRALVADSPGVSPDQQTDPYTIQPDE